MRLKQSRATLATGERPRVIISTDQVDEENDRVMQNGLSFRERMRVTLSHDYRALPVGLVTGIYPGKHRTEAEFEWFTNDETVDRVRNIYEQGGLDASIGFHVQDARANAEGGWDITRARVVEFALTAVPANAGALALVKSLSRQHGWRDDGEDINLAAIPFDVGDDLSSDEIVTALREGFRQARREMSADEVDITPAELRAVIRDVLGATVATEVRSAINALTGRVD
jgi:hypothetical protein